MMKDFVKKTWKNFWPRLEHVIATKDGHIEWYDALYTNKSLFNQTCLILPKMMYPALFK